MAWSRASSPDEAGTHERDDLLATKLNIPRIRDDLLGRSRLIRRLEKGIARELILVCTPAGFGKTTLLADWAAGAKSPVAWLSLDPEDNDPVRFWRYIVATLDRACPGIAEHMLPLVSLHSVMSSQEMVTTLINQLEAAPGQIALVLDDYHVIGDGSIHDAMAFFLGHLPPRLHVVISSRSDPPLAVARLRARGQLVELRATDLRFTPEESAVLLRDVWGLDMTAEAIGALDTRTEGWAVGLQLAALSLRERSDPDAFLDAFAGTHRYVLDYLSEEVLERQPDWLRGFLLQISILQRLTGPLCDAVTGRSDSQEMLEELERANLFLTPLDEERRWWRFHQLFGDLLRARLQRADGGRVAELHHRAAAWCEQHGLIDEAIHHATVSGDAMWAVRLVELHAHETIGRGESVVLDRWLSSLPDDVVRSRPALSVAMGEMQFHLGHLDRVERLLEQARRDLDHGHAETELVVPTHAGIVAEVPAAIALLRAELAGARSDPDGMAGYARSALEQMAEDEQGPRFWARWLSGAGADWMRGRLGDAEPIAARLLAEGRAAPDPSPLITSCYPLAAIQQGRGRLGAALRTYREGLRLGTRRGRASPFHAAEAHLGIAQVLYERDQLDDALEHVTRSIELGRHLIWFFEPGRRLVTLAWIRHALGDADGALEAMNEACRMHPSSEINSRWNPVPVERTRLWLALGQIAEAERWTEERGLTADDDVSYMRELDHLMLARVLLARSDPDRALRLLQRLEELADAQDRMESLIQIRTVRSLALQAAGHHHDALSVLTEALAMARPEGYIRIFADEGPPMAALVQSLVRQRGGAAVVSRAARAYLHRVVRAFRSPVDHFAAASTAGGPIEPLTRRELEVLGLIAAGMANREIADRLVVTLATVKKHTSHIFDKLGAANRTQAVARARELHLIQ